MDKFIICRALIYFTAEICASAGVSHYMENVGLCLCDSKTVLSLKSGDCDEKTYARVVMQAFKPILCFSVLLKVKNILEEGTS